MSGKGPGGGNAGVFTLPLPFMAHAKGADNISAACALRRDRRGKVRPRRASPLDGAVSGHERFRGAEIVWPGTRTGTQVEGSYQARLASTNWIKRRDCLEELKTHRLKLMADFNRLRPDLNFDSSPALRDLAEDLAAIDAGFDWTCRSYRANGNKR